MNASFVQQQKTVSAKGEIIVHIYPKNIREIITPLPPKVEQIDIANFLDGKTTKIDKLISNKQSLIELLKEERSSLINETLSGKGTGWVIKKLKYLGEAIIGITYSPEDVTSDESGILVLRSSNIQNGLLSFKDNVFVNKEIKPKLKTVKGDILICARNGSAHLVGKCALINEKYSGLSFGAFMTVFRSNYGEFLYHYFNSDLFRRNIGSFSSSTINQLTSDTLNNLVVSIPNDTKEQTKVVQFLKDETHRIDSTISKIEKEIELMLEYKTALISEAVTGKIKVI
jgi:type I restriction enzyme S subunit